VPCHRVCVACSAGAAFVPFLARGQRTIRGVRPGESTPRTGPSLLPCRHGPALLLLHAIARTPLAACTKRSFIFLVAVVASMTTSGPCSAGGTRRASVGDAGASATHAVTAPATQTTPTVLHATRRPKFFLSVTGT
jgi:hypothetical protein